MPANEVDSIIKAVCGIVMPISSIDGCDENHWSEVMDIISDSVRDANFEPNLVSSSDDIGVIQKRIIQNLYDNPIVVCDVSCKNANVMFELGIRLAFDKPTIIIKDDKTSYSFDTSPIEHLSYPRDLRFSEIVNFKKNLSEKIKRTYEKSNSDSSYTTFLGHFGTFKVAKLDQKEVSEDEFIMEELREIRSLISNLSSNSRHPNMDRFLLSGRDFRDADVFARNARKAVRQYLRDKKISPKEIDGDFDTLAAYVEEAADAPKHFNSPHAFREAFKLILSMMY